MGLVGCFCSVQSCEIRILTCTIYDVRFLYEVIAIWKREMRNNGLTAKQKRLVDTIVANACSIKKASELAGYSKGESGRVTASKALKLPHVQQYMMQVVTNSIGLNATKALKRIVDLSDSAKSEYVQLEASKDILDRAGYKAPDKVMHSHVGNISVNIDLT